MAYDAPAEADLNGSPSEGEFKTAIGALLNYALARLGGGSITASATEQATARTSLGVPAKNWLINPDGAVAQNLPASSADGDYDFDQWYTVTQTGSVASTKISNPEDGYRYGMRMTQSQASAQRMGRCQIIEGSAASELRGKTVTFGGRRRLSTSANIRMAVLVWTGTEDSPVKDQVNDWTSSTYTTGNFFKSTTLTVSAVSSAIAMTANTARDCSVTATISSSATNVIVMEWTESTVAQNVTFDSWGGRLIVASTLIDAIRRDYSEELALCQRYYWVWGKAAWAWQWQWDAGTSNNIAASFTFPVRMRAAPTASLQGTPTYSNTSSLNVSAATPDGGYVYFTVTSAGNGYVTCSGSSNYFQFSARLGT